MNKQEKWIVVLLVILIVISLYQNSIIGQLKNELDSQRYSFQRISEDISKIDQNVNTTLNEWERENRWVRDSGYKIESISDDLKNMTISVFCDFNSLNTNEKVYLNVGRYDNSNTIATSWEKIAVESTSDLHFEKVLTLPFKANYEIEVIAESESGKRSEELSRIEIYDQLIDRIQTDGHIGGNSDRLYMNINVFNPNIGLGNYFVEKPTKVLPEQLRIEKATLEVYVEDKLSETIDLLKDGELRRLGGYEEEIRFEKTYEKPDFDARDLKAIVKIQDKLGIEYEKEIELYR